MIALYIFCYFILLLIYGATYKAFTDDLPSIGEMILWPIFIVIRLMKYIGIGVLFIIKEILLAFKELGKVIID